MKPTLNEEIEMSAKGVDYVDSLVPKTPARNTNFTKKDIDSWKPKNNNFPKIIFVCLVIKLIICAIAIIKISEL